MYRVGTREKNRGRRKRIWRIASVLFIILGVLGYFWIKSLMVPHTKITQSKAKVTTVNFVQGKTKVITETYFSFSLPVDWEEVSHDTVPFNVYTFRSTDKNSKNRIFQIYEDKIQTTIAVNRMLPIESGNSRITLRGSVSDNCDQYTRGVRTNDLGVKAKWEGVEFLCDLANPQRNRVGTSSLSGIDIVGMVSSNSGVHNYFFLYTENTIQNDYTVLYTALQSFTLK
jgi:hypothetical protein